MDNYIIKFMHKRDKPKIDILPGHAWMTAHVVNNQCEAILAAIGAVNSGMTDIAQVYKLDDGLLIYETMTKVAA